jgi:pyruvate,water dikinase
MTVVALHEAADRQVFGGKAVELGAALRAGLPVPDGVALSVELVAAVSSGSPAALDTISGLVARLGGAVAARSSAVGEDSAEASFAGQHATVLNATTATALADAIRTVHSSGHSESALAYRSRSRVSGAPRIAVVVQQLVRADVAGVLFTRDPMSGRDERVIESAWGLGEAVVAGLINPDRYRIARSGAVLSRTVGVKDVMIVARAGGGVEEVAVAPDRVSVGLTDGQLRALHELATRCEVAFGDGGHDLEWAFADDDLYLLQRRPITRNM